MKISQQQHIYTHIHTCVIQSVVFFSLLWLSWKQRILFVDVLHFHVNWEFWLVRRDLYSNVTNPLKMVTADVGEILGGRIHDRPWLLSLEDTRKSVFQACHDGENAVLLQPCLNSSSPTLFLCQFKALVGKSTSSLCS